MGQARKGSSPFFLRRTQQPHLLPGMHRPAAFTCDVCKARFASADELLMHLGFNNGGVGPKPNVHDPKLYTACPTLRRGVSRASAGANPSRMIKRDDNGSPEIPKFVDVNVLGGPVVAALPHRRRTSTSDHEAFALSAAATSKSATQLPIVFSRPITSTGRASLAAELLAGWEARQRQRRAVANRTVGEPKATAPPATHSGNPGAEVGAVGVLGTGIHQRGGQGLVSEERDVGWSSASAAAARQPWTPPPPKTSHQRPPVKSTRPRDGTILLKPSRLLSPPPRVQGFATDSSCLARVPPPTMVRFPPRSCPPGH